MHRAQDWELNYRLRSSGRRIWFSPELRVTYRPRSSLGALARQMYDTGRWRREVVRRHPETASARYLAPPVAVVVLVAGTLAGCLGVLTGSRLLKVGFAGPGGYPALVLSGAVTAPEGTGARGPPTAAAGAGHDAHLLGGGLSRPSVRSILTLCLNKVRLLATPGGAHAVGPDRRPARSDPSRVAADRRHGPGRDARRVRRSARDRYQIITEHPVGQIIAEDTGLGYTRTDGVTVIQIFQQGRTTRRSRRRTSSWPSGWKPSAASARRI